MNNSGKFLGKCHKLATKTINEVLMPKNICSFLNIVAHCYNQPYINQLLIWKQRPDATEICGVNAWKNRGRKIREGEKPIVIIIPRFEVKNPGQRKTDENGKALVEKETGIDLWEEEPTYIIAEILMPVFDVSQTEGEDIKREESSQITGFIDRIIKKKMGLVVSEDDIGIIPALKTFLYVEDDKTLYISKRLNEAEREREALRFYIHHWVTEELKDPPDNLDILEVVILYVIGTLLGEQPSHIIQAKLSRLERIKTPERFIATLNYSIRELSGDVLGQYLDVIDTTCVNGLLNTDDKTLIYPRMTTVCHSISNDVDIVNALHRLSDKLSQADDACIEKLYMDKWRKAVYTFPPYKI